MTEFRIAPTRRGAIALAFAALALPLLAGRAFAYDNASKSAVNVDKSGVALRGNDPVAYFTAGRPTPGSAQFAATHDGATYHFANAANRDAFLKEPAKFAPAFGGFCAMGAALEKKLDGDPSVWRIVDGKLYLNVGAPVQTRWLQDTAGNIAKANQNWTKIKDKAPNEL